MIIDKLENLEQYVSLNPLFAEAFDYIKSTDLNAHESGKTDLIDGKLAINFSQIRPKTKEEAKLETHNCFIDIQIPLTGMEIIGYTPRGNLAETPYDSADDISFYEGPVTDYLTVRPGMFAIFFPQDAHAPGITPEGLKKVIVKVHV